MKGGDQTYHFISGLPRSGSTLLAALLKQNPAFHAGISSPVAPVFEAVLAQVSAGNEFAPLVSDTQRKRMLRAIFDAYYADQTDRSVVFDTNRMWTAKMPLLMDQFPGSKVIACVRNVAWVMDSLERLYRANPYELTRLFNDTAERNTVYSRVETLGQRNRLVGFAWTALKEAFYGEHAKSLLLVDFDLLVSAPERVMSLIYRFLDEPPYVHDYENIAFDAPVFDAALGLHGLHRVRPRVGIEPRHTILPPDLFAQFTQLAFWHDTTGSQANVIAVTPSRESSPQ